MAYLVRSNLRQLIVLLALIGTLVTVLNMFLASAKVQKQVLIENTLESNQAYAEKLAAITEDFLHNTILELTYSAKLLSQNWKYKDYQRLETTRLAEQNHAFNSVVLGDDQGVVLASSANAAGLLGRPLYTIGVQHALAEKKPLISEPYESAMGNLVIMISAPVYSEQDEYLGFIGGTIYLKEKNILNRLLGEHRHRDGSYIYVIDHQKRLLYHPRTDRLGQTITGSNPLIDLAVSGKTGQAQTTNSEGIPMIAGYAYIPSARWGVVSQRPTEVTLQAHDNLMQKVFWHSLPINVGVLVLIWLCAWLIAYPLRLLATHAKNMRKKSTLARVENIKTWYYEANELKTGFLIGLRNIHDHVGQLNLDLRTDPLTGLHNRRTLDYLLEKYKHSQPPFSVIAIDIDRFKKVNDTFGHDVGDEVLKTLATLLQKSSRDHDCCIRLGGEEFILLLPNTPLAAASDIAERLRQSVAHFTFPTVGHLTISLGVAAWPDHHPDISTVLKYADDMLYLAKQQGRNQVQIAKINQN